MKAVGYGFLVLAALCVVVPITVAAWAFHSFSVEVHVSRAGFVVWALIVLALAIQGLAFLWKASHQKNAF